MDKDEDTQQDDPTAPVVTGIVKAIGSTVETPTTGATPGPYVLHEPEADDVPPKLNYYIRTGVIPTADQTQLSYLCSTLYRRIVDFRISYAPDNSVWGVVLLRGLDEAYYRRALAEIRDTFRAGLVERDDQAIYSALERQITDYESDFVRQHAAPRYRWRIMSTLVLGVLVLALIGWLAARFEAPIAAFLGANYQAYLFTIYGVLVGRLLSLFTDLRETMQTFPEFYALRARISYPPLDAMIDVVIGFVACLAFTTGAIVISIGQTAETSGTGLTTLRIGESWEIAMVFGVLVGLVRAQFLGRLGRDAKDAIG